ncbi:MAG: hypothetical protein ACFB10_00340 [Salibacteraceae bacterium]
MKLLKDGNQVKIYLDEENNWIYLDWFGVVRNEWVIEGLELLYEAFVETKVGVILNDNTNLHGTWTGVINYIVSDWYPRSLKAGYRRAAFIYSSDVFTRFSVDALREQDLDSPIEQITVNSMEEAKAWLKEQAEKGGVDF